MKLNPILETFRLAGFGKYGAFQVGQLRIVSSGTPLLNQIGWPWEHVSVSAADRCPTWAEMCQVKDWFWEPEDVVVQFHPPKSQYVNYHPHCLHLWRRLDQTIELPPREFV